ncbi:TAXI family TRAP transporter solute-binding subunit [Bacillus piscicola]|uniref:TAXI family TRAP transporter solute-binding subunit n=1 Tax=Bacillus piscicola TaxID=1632684 RepID=UPI001F096AB1|nr:TAXI family TRAP transporter solute-binding subunit [Bacillus piscicola]
MKQKTLVFMLLAGLLVAVAGCSEDSSTSANGDEGSSDVLNIELSTATTTGNFYPMGAALANIWNDEVDGVKVASQSSDGSVQNLNLMQEGSIKMGLSTLGVLYNAYNGTDQFEGREFKDVRVVSTLFSDAGQVVVKKDSGVESVEDLVGKSFVPGAPGSGAKDLTEVIFEAYDMTIDDTKAQFVGYSQATDLMRDGKAIGAQVMSALPTSAVIEMLSTTDSEIISLTDEAIEKLTEEHSWLVEYTISSDVYDELDKDIQTVAQPSVLIASKDMPEDVIYELTKAMWENLEPLHNTIAASKTMELENATKRIADIPLHPGAEKYYKEKGVLQEQ